MDKPQVWFKRRVVAVLSLLLFAVPATADPVIVGKWQSDRELTMLFAKEHARLQDKTYLFLEQMMGRMTLSFTAKTIRIEMPDWQSETAAGGKSQLVGFRETHAYKVIGSSHDQVAVVSAEPVTGRKRITVYNFEDEDTMWVYLGGGPFPQMNMREYFVRVK